LDYIFYYNIEIKKIRIEIKQINLNINKKIMNNIFIVYW